MSGENIFSLKGAAKLLVSLPTRLARFLILVYQRLISPMLPPSCRFRPTCSQYAAEALAGHGFLKGSWLALKRLLKCHPFHPGGYDPAPAPKKKRDLE